MDLLVCAEELGCEGLCLIRVEDEDCALSFVECSDEAEG